MSGSYIIEAIVIAMLATGMTAAQVTPITVTTSLGDVVGERTPYAYNDSYITVDTTVDIFRGIPFAKPPVGNLRFAKPEEVDPWAPETYDATYFRAMCWQVAENNISVPGDQSEDCLHLNIYSPNSQGSGFPVFVRIHGGGFVGGDGITAGYDGRPIVSVHDVVLVTIHYRLNAFGFLATGQGDPGLAGNYGLWDQNLALKWIKENIDAFGGDPNSITIQGTSAGAASVGFHLLAGQSWDYFNRGILVSGNMMSPWGLELDTQKARDDAYLLGRLTGCGDATTGLQLRSCLRQVSERDLVIAANAVLLTTTNFIPLVPTIDGEFITDDPRNLLQRKKFKMCEILVGNTKDDGTLVTLRAYPTQINQIKPYSDYATFLDRVSRFTYTYTNDIIVNSIAQQYVDWEDFDDETTNYFYKYIELITDEAFHCTSEHTARAYAMSGNGVYRYYFNYLSPGSVQVPTWYGVSHGSDKQYFFAYFMNPRLDVSYRPEEKQFSLAMMRYYTNFAKTGNPNLPETVDFEWGPFTVPGLNILEQKPTFEAKPGMKAEYNAFWNDNLQTLVTYTAGLSEAEHQWREEFNRWKNDDLPAWRSDFSEYQECGN